MRNMLAWLSTDESRKKKWIDVIAVAFMELFWILESILANYWWGAKKAPFVEITWGHITFPLLNIGLPIIWFFIIRKYSLGYLGLKTAKNKYWYLIAPLGVLLTFGFGIPTYLVITKIFPGLAGGGMAGTPPPLGYPLIIVFLVEFVKYPITAAIPHEIAYRGAVFQSITALGKRWFIPAILITTTLFVIYHFPFDFSFSAIYFNIIISIVAIFLLLKSGSLIPPMIFHSCIDIFAIMSSWGYYLHK
jgi:membrane protease YdiL (CAAX protease family)